MIRVWAIEDPFFLSRGTCASRRYPRALGPTVPCTWLLVELSHRYLLEHAVGLGIEPGRN